MSKTEMVFQKALMVIAKVHQNPKSLDVVDFLLRLATINPKDLVSAYERTTNGRRSQIVELLKKSYKIQAIQLYREQTGVSLLKAKEAVEKIANEEGIIIGS